MTAMIGNRNADGQDFRIINDWVHGVLPVSEILVTMPLFTQDWYY
jgi:hypothetical protein